VTPSPAQVVAALGDRPGVVWLDGGGADDGWSVVAWAPEAVHTDGRDWPRAGRALGRPASSSPASSAEVPFAGGVIGYVGFGAGHRVAPVPAQAATPEPEVWLARYPGALCLDHRTGRWHVAGSPGLVGEGRAVLEAAQSVPEPDPGIATGDATTVDRAAYERAVEQILALLHDGDCYQVNLTRPVWVRGAGPTLPAYLRLRRADAPYGAYLRLSDDLAVLSNSPELFLSLRGERLRSEPIKGTRPRGADPATDEALLGELRSSAKERAELTMIVDLVRNDLGRVARIGSVRAGERRLVALPTVFHAVQTVSAELAPGLDVWDALAACFPPGSVTGAPKVRACERIAALEDHPRGVYCGAIGYVSDSGEATWSVAIRTAVAAGGEVRYHVGGGVVVDSDPADEWAETVAKEAALRRALVG
jgi:para-aminobenzoate synthetase component I